METNSSRICKICDKRFASGKAMGGHMRSHFAIAKLPPKPQPLPVVDEDEDEDQQQQPKMMESSSSDVDLISNTDSLGSLHSYKVSTEVASKPLFRPNLIAAALNNNAETIDLSTDQYFLFGSWNGGLRNQTLRRRRSKRRRRISSLALLTIPERGTTRNQLSSSPSRSRVEVISSSSNNISDPSSPPIMSDEQLALCLLTLAKDKSVTWTKKDPHDQHVVVDEYKDFSDGEKDEEDDTDVVTGKEIEVAGEGEEENDGDDDDDDDDDHDDDDDELFTYRNVTKRRRMGTEKKLSSGGGKYHKCETCNKYLPSYQALGGHRASHTRTTNKAQLIDNGEEGSGSGDNVPRRKLFECPFCDKVFESGQALGGHKKVHFSYLGIANHFGAGAGAGAGAGSSDTSTTADIEPTTKCSPPVVAPTTTITTRRNILDLNLPPPIEDDDDEIPEL